MSDNTIAVPRGIRVGAYLTGTAVGLLGDPGVTYLGAEHQIDRPTAVFLGVVFGAVTVLTNILALSHLPLPTGTAPALPRVTVGGGPVPVRRRTPVGEKLPDPATVEVVTETTTEADHG